MNTETYSKIVVKKEWLNDKRKNPEVSKTLNPLNSTKYFLLNQYSKIVLINYHNKSMKI